MRRPRRVVPARQPLRWVTLALGALGALALMSAAPASHAPRATPRPLMNTGAPPPFDSPLGTAPLDTPLVVTGGFCEYRIGHFHAGFDFSTGRRVGARVYAPLSGHIARIRTSGVGYGRSLYLETDDGRLIQFGHLDAFAEPMASYAEKVQRVNGQYEQDLFPSAKELPIRQGQQIAWTGESGAGGPHMHFEIRRGDIAYHPMRAGLNARDASAPVLANLTLEPLDDSAFVQRAPVPHTIAFDGATDSVLVEGRVRAIVAVRDGVWEGVDRMMPWSTRLEWADQWVEVRFDSVSWATDMSQSDYVYDSGRVRGEKGLMMWAPPGWRPRALLSSAPLASEAGTLVMRPGDPPLPLTFRARDAAGNSTLQRLVLVAPALGASNLRSSRSQPVAPAAANGTPASGAAGSAPSTRAATFDLEALPGGCLRVAVRGVSADARDVRISYAGDDAVGSSRMAVRIGDHWASTLPAITTLRSSPPEPRARSVATPPGAVADPQGQIKRPIELRATGVDAGGRAWVATMAGDWNWLAIEPDRAANIEGNGIRWSLPEQGVFEPTVVLWRTVSEVPPLAEGVRRGGGLEIIPADLPLRRPAAVAVPGVLTTQDRAYRRSGGDWNLTGSERDSSLGVMRGESRSLGLFALLSDTLAPRVEAPVVRGSARGAYSRLGVEARLVESSSGVDARASLMIVDGVRMPAEWDPEAGVLRWRPRERPAKGSHVIEVVAGDKAGNVRRRRATIVID